MGARVLGLEMEELSDPHIASSPSNSWYYSENLSNHQKKNGRRKVLQFFQVDYYGDVYDYRPGVKRA